MPSDTDGVSWPTLQPPIKPLDGFLVREETPLDTVLREGTYLPLENGGSTRHITEGFLEHLEKSFHALLHRFLQSPESRLLGVKLLLNIRGLSHPPEFNFQLSNIIICSICRSLI